MMNTNERFKNIIKSNELTVEAVSALLDNVSTDTIKSWLKPSTSKSSRNVPDVIVSYLALILTVKVIKNKDEYRKFYKVNSNDKQIKEILEFSWCAAVGSLGSNFRGNEEELNRLIENKLPIVNDGNGASSYFFSKGALIPILSSSSYPTAYMLVSTRVRTFEGDSIFSSVRYFASMVSNVDREVELIEARIGANETRLKLLECNFEQAMKTGASSDYISTLDNLIGRVMQYDPTLL